MRPFTRCMIALLVLVACGGLTSACQSPRQSQEIELIVFAASSLTNAFDDLAAEFEADHPDVRVILNYAASSELVIQLSEGANADVFASANVEQMDKAVQAGQIGGQPIIFAANWLVIIVPADNPANITGSGDLAKPGVRLVLAGEGVPIRTYADQVIAALAADPAYGPAFSKGVYVNLVSEEDNVRRVVTKVVLGEADAGIVYASDVTPDVAANVRQIAIPDLFNVRAAYLIAQVSNSPRHELARVFIELALSERGRVILAKWGFGPVE